MYRVEIKNSSGYVFQVKAKEYAFSIDMRGVLGITPPDTLLASLGACIGVYIHKYAEGAGLALPEFSISVDADLVSQPLCFKKINVTLDLKGFKLEERRLQAMLDFVRKCPVHNTLKNNPEVEIKIK